MSTHLKYLKLFPSVRKYYLYQDGYYKCYTEDEMTIFLTSIFRSFGDFNLVEAPYIRRIFSNLKNHNYVSNYGAPQFDRIHISLENEILNMETLEFQKHSPKYFIPFKLSFVWDPSVKHPIFDNCLYSFYEKHEDRKQFLRSAMYAIIHQDTYLQYFLQIIGPGTFFSFFKSIIN
jgi:hypothetical protein